MIRKKKRKIKTVTEEEQKRRDVSRRMDRHATDALYTQNIVKIHVEQPGRQNYRQTKKGSNLKL